jgi:hypothetical protein
VKVNCIILSKGMFAVLIEHEKESVLIPSSQLGYLSTSCSLGGHPCGVLAEWQLSDLSGDIATSGYHRIRGL